MNYLEIQTYATTQLAELHTAQLMLTQEKASFKEAKLELEATLQAQKLVQEVAATLQTRVHQQVASLVTRCLATTFPSPYTFKIEFNQRRGKTEASILFVDASGNEVDASMVGGGVVDVAAFALRLACLLISQPRKRKLLVLDEPFRFVSASYRPSITSLLNSLSKELNIQFILVTHDEEFHVGRVTRV